MITKPNVGDKVQINTLGETQSGRAYTRGTIATVYEIGVGANEGNVVLQMQDHHLVVGIEHIDPAEEVLDAPAS